MTTPSGAIAEGRPGQILLLTAHHRGAILFNVHSRSSPFLFQSAFIPSEIANVYIFIKLITINMPQTDAKMFLSKS
jgi:hypothetical protein